jgi:hypothetical protein
MRTRVAVVAGIAAVLASSPLHSQGVQLQMSDNDISQYCFWNGRMFSTGSFFCVGKNKMLVCNVSAKEHDPRGERAS